MEAINTLPTAPATQPVKKSVFLRILVALLVLAALTGGAFFFYQKQFAVDTSSVQSETESYLKVLRRLTVVPDEVPVIADVDNTELVQGEPFLRRAQKGDVVLAFKAARWAVLYRPSTQQLIDTTQIVVEGEGDVPDVDLPTNLPGTVQDPILPEQPVPTEIVVPDLVPPELLDPIGQPQ